MRLDVFVAAALGCDCSRSQAARLIKAGLVAVNGAPARAARLLHAADLVRVEPAPPVARASPETAQSVEVEVLHADQALIVVNKPAGLVVHRGAGAAGFTLVDWLWASFPEFLAWPDPDGVLRPGIVHRLDKGTSGVMVIARNPGVRQRLARQFEDRTVAKTYLAVVRGIVGRDRFTVSRAVGRHPATRTKMSVDAPRARPAASDIVVLHRLEPGALREPVSLVKVVPRTGRTHQIRVHLASIGHPCLGDALYGGGGRRGGFFERQALHAFALELAHPLTGARVGFVAPPPADFVAFLEACGLWEGMARLKRQVLAASVRGPAVDNTGVVG
jgi:23S rRNA pseudouridine1911/1915/1917 synthase